MRACEYQSKLHPLNQLHWTAHRGRRLRRSVLLRQRGKVQQHNAYTPMKAPNTTINFKSDSLTLNVA